MIKPNANNEFCVIGTSNFIHVRIAGASSAKCGANKPRRKGFVVSFMQRATVRWANEQINENNMELCSRCAAHTTRED